MIVLPAAAAAAASAGGYISDEKRSGSLFIVDCESVSIDGVRVPQFGESDGETGWKRGGAGCPWLHISINVLTGDLRGSIPITSLCWLD